MIYLLLSNTQAVKTAISDFERTLGLWNIKILDKSCKKGESEILLLIDAEQIAVAKLVRAMARNRFAEDFVGFNATTSVHTKDIAC